MPKDRPASLAISKSEVVFSGKIWDIKSESFDYNGTTLIREFVAHPGAVAVIAMNHANQVLLINQYRHPVREYLWEIPAIDLWLLDVDIESIDYLRAAYPAHAERILFGDFLRLNPEELFGDDPFIVVGNFPYNISSQILFKCLEYRNQVPQIMGMFQKEVAERCAAKPGSKEYGILSVFLQAYYKCEYWVKRYNGIVQLLMLQKYVPSMH